MPTTSRSMRATILATMAAVFGASALYACNRVPVVPEKPAKVTKSAPEKPRQWSKGLASFYADSFEGKLTASGEPYRATKLTAAHRSLPFGTKVLVERLDNGRSVVVTINDRGPFVEGRIIDLSRSAAKELKMRSSGTVKVRIAKVH